jgi:acetyltransferase-like isoleucine patch superfamily enzyme
MRTVKSQRTVQADVRIGGRVWIGSRVTLMRGGSIGDDAITGANAVVTRPVPANCVAVGVPARVVRENLRLRP